MTIAADRARFFWLPPDPVTATEPAPATFDGSFILPCFDMAEYAARLQLALAEVGKDPNPANNAGDFIYIADWWLGLRGGRFEPPKSYFASGGPAVLDEGGFDLDPQAPKNFLSDVLKEKARRGVEVRAIAWLSYSLYSETLVYIPILGGLGLSRILSNIIAQANPGGFIDINAHSINSVQDLRQEPRIGKNAILSIIGHSAGSVHIKGCVLGTGAAAGDRAIAFAGGLDLVTDRWAQYGHAPVPGWQDVPPLPFWHDIQASIEGKAAQGFYDHFRAMWNENLRREPFRFKYGGEQQLSYLAGTSQVPARAVDKPMLSAPAALTHHVQSLRSVPAFNYRWYNCLPEGKAASFAPQGLFEVRAAWRKAILAAEKFIYIEDQFFYSREVMDWCNESLRAHPDLKVVLLMKGGGDPNDAPSNDTLLIHDALTLSLFGVGNAARELSPAQRQRVRVFQLFGERAQSSDTFEVTAVTPDGASAVLITFGVAWTATAANGFAGQEMYFTDLIHNWRVLGNPEIAEGTPLIIRVDATASIAPSPGDKLFLLTTYGVFVHAKTTIIDDKWALIGSANCARRSLYSDWEYSISFLDEAETAVRDYRTRLWAEHLKVANPADLDDLTVALGIFEPTWNPAGDSPPLPVRPAGSPAPPYLRAVTLPIVKPVMTPDKEEKLREHVDTLKDLDSRSSWGGFCPPPKEP